MQVTKDQKSQIKYRKPAIFLVIATILIAVSSFGWIKFQQEQERKITLAQKLLVNECQKPINNNNLSEIAANVNQAVELLNGIPRLPGTTHTEAQKQLTAFSECIKVVNANNNLLAASNLSKQALSINKQTVLSITEWQKNHGNLATAITRIQSIPSDVDVFPDAQTKLKQYQNQLNTIEQKITDENNAVDTFNRAQKLKLEAEKIIGKKNNFKSLSQAQLKVINGMQLIENLPAKTTVAENKQEYLQNYQNLLNNIQEKIAVIELKSLVSNFRKFADNLYTDIGYLEYYQRLEQLKQNFDSLTQKYSSIKNHSTTKSLATALSHYDDALVILRYCYEGNCLNSASAVIFKSKLNVLWLSASLKLNGKPITQKYTLPATTNILRKKYIQVNQALLLIWKQAESEIYQVEKV